MKKTSILVATLISFSAMSFAQNAPTPATTVTESQKTETKAPAPKTETKAPAPKKQMKKAEMVMGEITAVNMEKNEITLKVKKDKTEKTFSVDAKEIAKLKVGQEIKMKLVDGKVETIKEVKHQTKHAKHQKKAEVKTENPAQTK